jgi:hypothetical protein
VIVTHKNLQKGLSKMRMNKCAILIVSVCLLAASVSTAKTPTMAPTVAGVYENFTVGKTSGDLEGMRVVLIFAAGGYYALVQIAQGGAEDPKPEFVQATVKGMRVEFAVGDLKFTATATQTALRVKDNDGQTHVLKRKPCTSLFR